MKAPIQKIRELDHGDLQKSGFWVSQVFVVLATIIGVYLAANAGLEQAIRFDNIKAQEQNYHLRASLHDELQDNASVLRRYVEEVLRRNPHDLKPQHPALSEFVWETMRYSPATFETPIRPGDSCTPRPESKPSRARVTTTAVKRIIPTASPLDIPK